MASTTFVDNTGSINADWLNDVDAFVYGVEDWHEVGATGEPAFAGTWTNVGGVNDTAGFYKDGSMRAYVKGMVKSGTGDIFTLPVGYRPPKTIQLATSGDASFARIQVASTGVISLVNGSATSSLSINVGFRI